MLTIIAIEAGVILLLIVVNGLLAMSEMGIVSSRKVRLQQLAEDGNHGAEIALELANSPSNFLAAIQIGITMIGIFAGAFGGATIAEELARQLVRFERLAPYADAIGLGIVVVVVTYTSLIIGELVPKRLALGNPERIAAAVAPAIRLLSVLALPAVKLLGSTTDYVLRLLRVSGQVDPPVTEEEVKIMIAQGAEAGVFEKEEESMMNRVLDFSDRAIGEIMTPRLKIVAMDLTASFKENLEVLLETPHSYFPVYEENLDNVTGVVSTKCIIECMANKTEGEIDIKKCVTEPLYVSENMTSLKLLQRFKKARKHLAVVVNEYGTTAGVVTIVDVLEAIVGDLPHELESAGARKIVKRKDGSWLVDGSLAAYELNDLLDIAEDEEESSEGGYQTLGGFVMAQLGQVPSEGQFFEAYGYRFEVVDMDRLRVDKVLIMKISGSDRDESAEE